MEKAGSGEKMTKEKAQEILSATLELNQEIENLGYADMPEEPYKNWLKSVQSDVVKQQHKNEIRVLGRMIELKK